MESIRYFNIIMSTIKCLGVTAKGVKCTKPCKGGVRYCNLHKDQCARNNTNVSANNASVTNTQPSGTQECVICLCDIDDPYNLECFHVYHKECIKEWVESGDNDECPVCKAKISQNIISDLSIDDTQRSNKITIDKEAKLLEDEEYARSIVNDEHPLLQEQEPQSDIELSYCDIERAIQESLISQEMDDYDFMAKALEYSYQFAKKEEEEMIEKTIKLNLEEEIEARSNALSNESVPEMITRMMNGNTHITIKLR